MGGSDGQGEREMEGEMVRSAASRTCGQNTAPGVAAGWPLESVMGMSVPGVTVAGSRLW